MKIVYASNGGTVGDGARIARVSDNGQAISIMVDGKTERYSDLKLVADEGEPNPGPGPVDPGPGPNSPNGTAVTGDTGSITFDGHVYRLVAAEKPFAISVDGMTLAETNSVVEIFIHAGRLFQKAYGLFWERVGNGWGPELREDPRTPVDPGLPAGEYPALPEGFRKPGDFMASADKWAPQWGVDELTFPSWGNGVLTWGDPGRVNMRADGSAVLSASYGADGKWFSGEIQMNRPTRSRGRWGMLAMCDDPDAVCAFFIYERSSAEVDWEYVIRDGVAGWAPAVHMPKAGGGTAHSFEGRKGPLIPMSKAEAMKLHAYEFDFQPDGCRFYLDGVQVAEIKPSDMGAGAIWKTDAAFEALLSVEKHEGWAGHVYPVGTDARMTVFGIRIPG